jgi:hypothetical protein
VAAVVTWLVAGETSPFNEYFAESVFLNLWRGLHLIPFLASVVAGGHAGNDFAFYAAFAIHWLILGLVLAFIVLRFQNRSSESLSIF